MWEAHLIVLLNVGFAGWLFVLLVMPRVGNGLSIFIVR